MNNPSPYRKIAVASTFSPRFKQVLAEAKRIRDRFSSELHLIYVGDRDEETSKKFNDALAQLQLPADSPIHYEKGDPAQAILRALALHKINMIVAGAPRKGGRVASVSWQRRAPPCARSLLFGHALYQTGCETQTAAPNCFYRRLFRARIARIENDIASRLG